MMGRVPAERWHPGLRPVIGPVLAVLWFAACDGPRSMRSPQVDDAVVARAASAAALLREGLVQRLTGALDSAGPSGAIEVCAEQALPLSDSLARVAGVSAIKRTSDRVRNPANAPDAGDREALERFRAELDAGRPLPQYFVEPAGADEARYYEPLRIMPLCVQCHGAVEDLDPEVRRMLAERYPEDRAVGYQEGDFRGLIRISIPLDESRR